MAILKNIYIFYNIFLTIGLQKKQQPRILAIL